MALSFVVQEAAVDIFISSHMTCTSKQLDASQITNFAFDALPKRLTTLYHS